MTGLLIPTYVSAARTYSRWAGVFAAGVGGVVLLGWIFDVAALKSILPNLTLMMPNTALCFIFAGAAVAIQAAERVGPRGRALSMFCAAAVALLGSLRLMEFLGQVDLGVDQRLLWFDIAARNTTGHISPLTATNFCLLGIGLLAYGQLRQLAEQRLQDSESRLADIINSAIDAIISIDDEQRIVLFNPAAARIFQRPIEPTLGQSIDELIPERFRAAHREQVREFGRRDEKQRQMGGARRLSGLRATGEEFPVEASISQSVVGGQPLYTVILRDVSEQVRAEEDIRQLNAELDRRVVLLEAANKELEAFSYSVSHDLRAPLRAMDGFARIMVEDYAPKLDAEARRYLGLIQKNAQQMGELIDDLLAFSRLNRQPLKRRAVQLEALVRESLAGLETEQNGRRVELQIADLPPCEGDPDLLRQALTNLLSNALKFTRKREVAQIEVGSRQENGAVTYYVRDNGVGFDNRYIDKLFGVFQRLHKPEEYEGTGVGLAIVQRVVSRHGGRVWPENVSDQGATFCFTLGS